MTPDNAMPRTSSQGTRVNCGIEVQDCEASQGILDYTKIGDPLLSRSGGEESLACFPPIARIPGQTSQS